MNRNSSQEGCSEASSPKGKGFGAFWKRASIAAKWDYDPSPRKEADASVQGDANSSAEREPRPEGKASWLRTLRSVFLYTLFFFLMVLAAWFAVYLVSRIAT